ncbi:uncharacterized protein LOC114257623 [Camellia sinensis]|uniref:uncharacterized protein LOC114257623 n=1 Tax=Camellia sinensis TaxID=4442 RepID=UPI001036A159|nr:uncharacterized protein LOC114257623 [Camellia sinensis]
MKKDIYAFVAQCDNCQRNKTETVASPGLLQPLPIPEGIWSDISMDFVEGLPNSHGKTVILVVVDRLSKYTHFIALYHPYTAVEVAQAFLDTIYKLHGMPKSIVSDRDPIFFWQELFRLQVDQWGRDREATLKILKEHLVQAQNRMKQQADQHRIESQFAVGDWVLKKVGQVAYQLDLPPHSKLHLVFHVSMLKKKLGAHTTPQATFPPIGTDGVLEPEPIAALDRRLIKYKGRPATQLLVQWSNSYPEDATWELYQDLQAKFPTFQPWRQGSFQGDGNDRPVTRSDAAAMGQDKGLNLGAECAVVWIVGWTG